MPTTLTDVISKVRRLFVRRNYKDSLFRRIFTDKKDLLDLYNALNGTSYDDPNELEIVTLEDAIYLSVKNDLSFIISSTLNLYEHQSSINPNMPIRGFLYFAKQYEAYIARNKLDIYGSSLVKLPTPRYVVLYNGSKDQPDISELRLSSAFMNKGGITDDSYVLECKATVLNINYGHNTEMLNCCRRLHDYSFFVAKVNKGVYNGLSLEEAINNAVEYCIENDILADFLMKHKAEVDDMLLSKEGVKIHEEALVKEGYNTGYDAGYGEGAMSRQDEIDTLNAVNSDLKLDIDRLTAILKAHGIDPNQQ